MPVMMGYLFLGMAFGILMRNNGYGTLWSLLMSLFVYAGSMQFVAVNFFAGGIGIPDMILMTLMVNARHIFYGLSMLEPFQNMGWRKPYMVFSLTDETFSLLYAARVPEGIERNHFFFAISFLDQCYWVIGSVAGSLLGSALTFNTKGIDFAMTALFVVIFVEQWKKKDNRIPALIGVVGSVICLFIFGASNFVLPAMLVIFAALSLLRSGLSRGEAAA